MSVQFNWDGFFQKSKTARKISKHSQKCEKFVLIQMPKGASPTLKTIPHALGQINGKYSIPLLSAITSKIKHSKQTQIFSIPSMPIMWSYNEIKQNLL